MSKSWPSLEHTLAALAQATYQQRWDFLALAGHLQSLAEDLIRALPAQRRELIASFHNCAGKFPYPDDADIGALILEAAGDEVTDQQLRKWLYEEASFRARYCAESGTSGGECLARSKHLDRVSDKLRNSAR